jgi:hypothetical protein
LASSRNAHLKREMGPRTRLSEGGKLRRHRLGAAHLAPQRHLVEYHVDLRRYVAAEEGLLPGTMCALTWILAASDSRPTYEPVNPVLDAVELAFAEVEPLCRHVQRQALRLAQPG